MVIARDPELFEEFGCDVVSKNINTPDRLTPNITFTRKGPREIEKVMPDGKKVMFWTFEDPNDKASREMWPAKTIRVRQGQIVHSTLESKKSQHTIHHHGMNSSTYNDGVGHVSFEVSGSYTYQFQPHSAGTYFYHCHKNTVLHFELGMYGMLIVDPPEGPGRLFQNGPAYDIEAIWAIDDVDPAWRLLDHDAGQCGDDGGLDKFNPKYFMLTGVAHPKTKTASMIHARVGQRILIRHLNCTYSVVRTTIEGLDATIYGVDGRPLGRADRPWAQPIPVPAGTPFETVTAQRRDLIVVPTVPGKYRVLIECLDWVAKKRQGGTGIIETYINVT